MHSVLTVLIRSTLIFFLVASVFAGQSSPTPQPAAASAAQPAPAQASTGTVLDQKAIHNAYNEGDFEKVTKLIETFTKSNKTYSRGDSIFIAKHLAVVYSANPQTREKGKYYMYRLLEMMPSAELVDMFVSDEIDRIFEKVRKEFVARQKGFGVDSTQISSPEKPATGSAAHTEQAAASQPAGPSKEYQDATHQEKESFWKSKGMWVAGGVGLITAGTVVYLISTSDNTPATHTITIPNQTQAAK
ncbi:MAG: hypothetical protein JF616_00870 [Fibrobacteres bacterium]|nr:hypothetical protein [Fibrobacterota bacterium]